METDDLTEEFIQRLGSGGDLEGMMASEIFHENNLYMDDQDGEDNEPDDVIILHMDIREPLRSLQNIVEQKICVNLKGYTFWLQDAQELESHKNLVDQCVKGEGLVQINVQIQTVNQRINIVDVLKPTEAALAALALEEANKNSEDRENERSTFREEDSQDSEAQERATKKIKTETTNNKEKPCLNWVLDSKFKKEQTRLKIPEDPNNWTVPQVKHWFQWAVRQFDLSDVTMSDWAITGKELCSLTHEEFRKKLPKDPGNVFWTHLQLLKECKFVSVVHKGEVPEMYNQKGSGGNQTKNSNNNSSAAPPKELKIMRKPAVNYAKHCLPSVPHAETIQTSFINSSNHNNNNTSSGGGGGGTERNGGAFGVGSGNNGQVQLWQFLLEILTDPQHSNIIQWVGTLGEFKLIDPERVARLWGDKKNKPAMNYEKLSRALRYYYDGDMISKVSGKRFAYKFDCDLKLLIGYNAAELSRLVNEKSFLNETVCLEKMFGSDDE